MAIGTGVVSGLKRELEFGAGCAAAEGWVEVRAGGGGK